MDMRDIQVFRAVMRAGTTSKAAALLNVSQPAISQSIRKLEASSELRLFERTRGRLVPTQEALALQPEIFEIASRIQRLRDMSRELGTERKSVLRVACVPSIAGALLPPVLSRFMKQHPNVICQIETHSHAGIIDRLLRRQSDIGFSLASVPSAGIVEEALVSGRGVCVAPRGQFSEKKKEVTWKDLARHPVIRLPASSKFGGLMFEASQGTSQGLDELSTSPVIVTTNLLAMKLAEEGVGIATIDSFTASSANLELVRVLPLSPAIEVRLNWIRRTEGTLSNAARRFIQMVAAVGRERSV